MNSLGQVVVTGLMAGFLSGGAMGWLHHQLKPVRIHAVGNYIIGSSSCLIALTISLLVLPPLEGWMVAILAWMIWTITGSIVASAYLFDELAARQRKLRVQARTDEDYE